MIESAPILSIQTHYIIGKKIPIIKSIAFLKTSQSQGTLYFFKFLLNMLNSTALVWLPLDSRPRYKNT